MENRDLLFFDYLFEYFHPFSVTIIFGWLLFRSRRETKCSLVAGQKAPNRFGANFSYLAAGNEMPQVSRKANSIGKRDQMKKYKIYFLAFLLFALAAFSMKQANADFNAQDIVNQFNQSSGGDQFEFDYSQNYNLVVISEKDAQGFVDTSAYVSGKTGGDNYFTTFTITPDKSAGSSMSGTLHYENGMTHSTPHNDVTRTVSLGAASLYASYATLKFDDFNNPDEAQRTLSAYALEQAIQTLTGSKHESWETNKFLARLLLSNDNKEYWLQAYDPEAYYREIGDFSVFAMNSWDSDQDQMQTFLYLAKREPGTLATPEPSTAILWGLGSIVILGSLYKKRKKKGEQSAT